MQDYYAGHSIQSRSSFYGVNPCPRASNNKWIEKSRALPDKSKLQFLNPNKSLINPMPICHIIKLVLYLPVVPPAVARARSKRRVAQRIMP